MTIKSITTICIFMLLSLLTGCSLFMPSHQTVCIQSVQTHAKVWVNGNYVGEAPVQTSVRRNETLMVIVKKDGFETSSRVVNHHLSTAGTLDMIGTCIFLIPCVGFCTSGAFSLDETSFIIQLAPAEQSATGTNTAASTSKE